MLIDVAIEKYTGAVYYLKYTMVNAENGELVFEGRYSYCFIDASGRPVSIKKHLPELDILFKEHTQSDK